MRLVPFVLALGCTASPSVAPAPAPAVAPPPFTATARVCVHCTGPAAVDAEGHAIASIYVTIEARVGLAEVRLGALELTAPDGGVLARGGPTEYAGRVTEPPVRDLGRFDGRIAAGVRVVVWTGARLDIQDAALWRRHPARFRLRIDSGAGSVDLAGAVEPLGPTG